MILNLQTGTHTALEHGAPDSIPHHHEHQHGHAGHHGHAETHEADMVARGLRELNPSRNSIVMIENVGNLVCPALFDLGEWAKVVVLSVTEGEDKPLKYPHMFRAARLMVLNKIDLLPHVEFDTEHAASHARQVNPDIVILPISARTGQGLDAWYGWLRQELALSREAALR